MLRDFRNMFQFTPSFNHQKLKKENNAESQQTFKKYGLSIFELFVTMKIYKNEKFGTNVLYIFSLSLIVLFKKKFNLHLYFLYYNFNVHTL